MKPLSPYLFLTAVQAATVRLRIPSVDQDCALQFVNVMGHVAHLDGTFDSSSWPLGRARSVAELLACATEADMLRHDAAAGDIVLFGRPALPSVAVVLAVLEQGIGPVGRTIKCRVIYAMPTADQDVRIVCRELWCRPSSGDRFVRWYEGRTGAVVRRCA